MPGSDWPQPEFINSSEISRTGSKFKGKRQPRIRFLVHSHFIIASISLDHFFSSSKMFTFVSTNLIRNYMRVGLITIALIMVGRYVVTLRDFEYLPSFLRMPFAYCSKAVLSMRRTRYLLLRVIHTHI